MRLDIYNAVTTPGGSPSPTVFTLFDTLNPMQCGGVEALRPDSVEELSLPEQRVTQREDIFRSATAKRIPRGNRSTVTRLVINTYFGSFEDATQFVLALGESTPLGGDVMLTIHRNGLAVNEWWLPGCSIDKVEPVIKSCHVMRAYMIEGGGWTSQEPAGE